MPEYGPICHSWGFRMDLTPLARRPPAPPSEPAPRRKPPAEVPVSQREVFGENLRLAREQQDILQKDLAASVSISRAYLSQIESGVRNTNLDLASALAAAVGKSIDELLEPPRRFPSTR